MTIKAPLVDWLLLLLMGAVALLSPHVATGFIWQAPIPPPTNLWFGFRSVAVYLVDIPLISLMLFGFVYLAAFLDVRNKLFQTGQNIVEKHGGFWWMLLFIWAGLSTIWAREPALARFNALHLLLEFWLALWLAFIVQRGYAHWLLLILIIGAVGQSGLAFAQSVNDAPLGLTWLGEMQRDLNNPFGFGPDTFRGYGLAIHPNNLGGYLVIALYANALLVLDFPRTWPAASRFALWLTGGIIAVGLLATGSKSAWLAAILTFPLWIFAPSKLKLSRRQMVLIVMVIVVGVLLISVLGGDFARNLWQRVFNVLEYRDYPQELAKRLTFAFPDTTAIIRQSPITGVGGGNLMVEISYLRGGSLELLLPAHNVFWIIWAELGIVGMTFFVGGLVFIFIRLHPANGLQVYGWGLCLLAMLIIMLFDYYFWGDLRSRTMLFWVLGLWWGQTATLRQSLPTRN